MRRTIIALVTSFAATLAIAAAAETPPAPQEPETASQPADPGRKETTGTVTEAILTSENTYVEVDIGDRRIWAAGPIAEVAVGDTVTLSPGVFMVDFYSRQLGRTFDEIYLVHTLRVESGGPAESASPPADEGDGASASAE